MVARAASEAISHAASSSESYLRDREWKALEEAREAAHHLESLVRDEIRKNPTGWMYGTWRVTFVNDSKYANPPVIKFIPRA